MKKLLLAPLVLLVGCDATMNIEGSGDILSDDGNNCYLESQECTETVVGAYQKRLTAVPRDGWMFAGWKYCQSSTGPVCTFDVDAETVKEAWGRDLPPVTAVFKPFDANQTGQVTQCMKSDNMPDYVCTEWLTATVNFTFTPPIMRAYMRIPGVRGASHAASGNYLGSTFSGISTGDSKIRLTVTTYGSEFVLTQSGPDWHITFNGVLL